MFPDSSKNRVKQVPVPASLAMVVPVADIAPDARHQATVGAEHLCDERLELPPSLAGVGPARAQLLVDIAKRSWHGSSVGKALLNPVVARTSLHQGHRWPGRDSTCRGLASRRRERCGYRLRCEWLRRLVRPSESEPGRECYRSGVPRSASIIQ